MKGEPDLGEISLAAARKLDHLRGVLEVWSTTSEVKGQTRCQKASVGYVAVGWTRGMRAVRRRFDRSQ